MGKEGLEPPTSSLSERYSNHLSYLPKNDICCRSRRDSNSQSYQHRRFLLQFISSTPCDTQILFNLLEAFGWICNSIYPHCNFNLIQFFPSLWRVTLPFVYWPIFGRVDRIRTCDNYIPNVAFYQLNYYPILITRCVITPNALSEFLPYLFNLILIL